MSFSVYRVFFCLPSPYFVSAPLHNRELSGLLVPLELKDLLACKVCPENVELLEFLDPKETE